MHIFKYFSYFRHLAKPIFVTLGFLMTLHNYGLSETNVSVLYCGIGKDVYSIFGHAAVRVQNNSSDYVYNYGTFDSRTHNFLKQYLKGDLLYFLSRETYSDFISSYSGEGREIKEFFLQINQEQANSLENQLLNNYYSSKGAYRYQFLEDNCSTRIYELLKTALVADSLQMPSNYESTTYRKALNDVLKYHSGLRLPINIFLGVIGERDITPDKKAFLPDSLVVVLNSLTIQDHKGERKMLIRSDNLVSLSEPFLKSSNYDVICAILFFLLCLIFRSKYLLVFPACLGLIIFFLMLFSYREEFVLNYNILVANPLDLLYLMNRPLFRRLHVFLLSSNVIYLIIYFISGIHYLPLLILNVAILILKVILVSKRPVSLFKL